MPPTKTPTWGHTVIHICNPGNVCVRARITTKGPLALPSFSDLRQSGASFKAMGRAPWEAGFTFALTSRECCGWRGAVRPVDCEPWAWAWPWRQRGQRSQQRQRQRQGLGQHGHQARNMVVRAAAVGTEDGVVQTGEGSGWTTKSKSVLDAGLEKDAQARRRKKELAFGNASAMEVFVVIFADYQSDLIVLDLIDRVISVNSVLEIGKGALLAYVLGDLLSGVLLWALYNYASASLPIIGDELSKARMRYSGYLAKQRTPDEGRDTGEGEVKNRKRDARAVSNFFRLCMGPCQLTLPGLTIVAGWGASSSLMWESFLVFLLSIIAVLPQLHAWSLWLEVPTAVEAIQRTGLLARRSERLDTGGYIGSIPRGGYCCVSGLGNVLGVAVGTAMSSMGVGGGEDKVVRGVERALWRATGGRALPRVWAEYGGMEVVFEEGGEVANGGWKQRRPGRERRQRRRRP